MSLKELWTQIIEQLMTQLPRPQVLTWFKNTVILEKTENALRIGLPLPYFLSWHEAHLASKTLAIAKKIDPSIQKLHYEVDIALNENHPDVVDLLKHFPSGQGRKLPKSNQTKSKEGIVSNRLNEKYTLEDFITSPENRLAHAACQNVGMYPGRNYNPLFIYGGVGLGKTHLLQATGNAIIKNNPGAFVVYTTTEDFTNEVVKAIRSKNMEYIRKKYRRVDALIIDDIQFIANKDRTEEEFFHTFNALYEAGKQVIISSDRPPHELKLLSDRLVSRFESGMTIDVKIPDFEARLAILMEECRQSQVFINQEVLEFIAMNVASSVRALKGVLNKVIASYELEHVAPTVNSVMKMLRPIQPKQEKVVGFEPASHAPRKAITLDDLIDTVSDYFAIERDQIEGSSRARESLVPRQVIMYLANTKLRLSLSKIGNALGKRNHTTVMHSVSRVKKQLQNDRQLLRDINAIVREAGLR